MVQGYGWASSPDGYGSTLQASTMSDGSPGPPLWRRWQGGHSPSPPCWGGGGGKCWNEIDNCHDKDLKSIVNR